jgi:hypothetical protein
MRKKQLSKEKVFSLKGYTLKVDDGKFYAAATTHFDDKASWSGPYKTLDTVCKAIAKKLAEEYQRRSKLVTS